MIFTIGHSTLAPGAFLQALDGAGTVIDVRSYPASRRYPHFDRQVLQDWLLAADVTYEWWPALGGRRKMPEGVPDDSTGWRVSGFAAYAWHTANLEWLAAVDHLVELAGEPIGEALANGTGAAVMCAEALWWRCHRSLIADHLVWRGFEVVHLPGGALHSEVVGNRLERFPVEVVEAWRDWTRPR